MIMADKIREVFHSKEFFTAVILFITLIASAFIGSMWATTNFGGEYVEVYYLDNYEKQVAEGEFCFEQYFEFKGLESFDKTITVFLNNEETSLLSRDIKFSKESKGLVPGSDETLKHIEKFCIDSSVLQLGNNKIIISGAKTLFFNIEKVDSLEPLDYSLELIDLNKRGLIDEEHESFLQNVLDNSEVFANEWVTKNLPNEDDWLAPLNFNYR